MRVSTAYFAGVGTVIAAVAVGLGGGYLAANIANPPPGVSKLERRMSSEPISVAAAPSQPAPRFVATSPAPAQQSRATANSETGLPTETAPPANDHAPPATDTIGAEAKAAGNVAAVTQMQPVKLTDPKAAEQAVEKSPAPRDGSLPRDAYAKARGADIKRAEADKRRAERRQAWVERRKIPPRGEELDAVEERVREVTEPRQIRIREESEPRAMFVGQRSSGDAPRIGLFGLDD